MVLGLALGSLAPAWSQVSIGIATPGVSIGINVPAYPQFAPVPGYPVYYAPALSANYFFYDGMYWVYQGDNWYASSWFNGPWWIVAPEVVPVYLLRVPVRYYRRPPPYFRAWQRDAPPHWGEHWGGDWNRRRSGWDQWDHHSVPPRAPLPTYQRSYSGNKYPHVEQQAVLQNQKYRYQPREAVVQQHYQAQRTQGGPPAPRQEPPHQGQPHSQQQAPRPPDYDRSPGKGSGPPSPHDKGSGKGEQGGGEHKK
jgi:hypothetical protein